MKFDLLNPHALQIEAETRDEVREVLNHFKLDPFEYVDEISRGGRGMPQKRLQEWHGR